MHLVINKIAAGIQPVTLKRAVLEALSSGRLDDSPPSTKAKWKHKHEKDILAMDHLVMEQADKLDNVDQQDKASHRLSEHQSKGRTISHTR